MRLLVSSGDLEWRDARLSDGADVEVKIGEHSEVLVRGPMLLKEYYKRPEATAEAIDADGYFRTGDAGFFDDAGQLKIIDRSKDVGKLANGAMFAPNYIENKLKFFPHIKEAVAFGHGRDGVCAFINIDIGSVGTHVCCCRARRHTRACLFGSMSRSC